MSKRRGRGGAKPRGYVPENTGFAVFMVRSVYSGNAISSFDGPFRCKKLDWPVEFTLQSDVYDAMDELILGCYHGMRTVQTNLDAGFGEEPGTVPDPVLEPGPDDVHEDLDDVARLHERISELEDQLSRTTEEKDSEIEGLRRENMAFKETVESLRIENSELEATKNHFAKEARFSRRTDVHGIMQSVLEFMASVNNTVTDNQASDDTRKLVSIYTERLIMALSSKGIRVTKHDRGEPLGDGRLEIMEQETDDPSLDMKVAKSVRYGCTFSDGIHPAVPEDLTVYVYRKRSEDTATEDSHEFRLRAEDETD